jgi:hypothetical protein
MSGSYMAEISRKDPACILFLLDQSSSMSDSFAGDGATRKADAAADAINKLLMNLVLRCTQNIGEGPRNYFDVGVIGYGSRRGVGPAFGGALTGRTLVSINDLATGHLRVEERARKVPDGAGGLADTVVKFPVWFDPVAENGTPMREGLQLASSTVQPWMATHKQSYPPIVINITDGEPATDPTSVARALTELNMADGDLLLYNIHLSGASRTPILFPGSSAGLPDAFARMLFDMSSVLPSRIQQELKTEGYAVDDAARGFIFNADPAAFIQFLDIGTRLVLRAGGDR